MAKKMKKAEKRHYCKIIKKIVFVSNIVLFLGIFFTFSMLLTGGWDDISLAGVLICPVVSVFLIFGSMLNLALFDSNGTEVFCSVANLGFSALVSFAYFIYPAILLATAR